MVELRKALFILLSVLILVGCGDELDQTLIDETSGILEIIDTAIYNNKELTNDDRKLIGEYLKYYDNQDLSEKNKKLYHRMWYLLEHPEDTMETLEVYESYRQDVIDSMEE